jgi:tagatose-6-phosphate ketose/aldose isomerase
LAETEGGNLGKEDKMPLDSHEPAAEGTNANSYTRQEIFAQARLWPGTVRTIGNEVERLGLAGRLRSARAVLTGAGTSAYAAEAIAAAWPQARAVPTTDLLVDGERLLSEADILISLARSGDSPESAAVVQVARSLQPDLFQLAIVCNANGALAQSEVDHVLKLDPRTDDHSLVMTSSYSNLVLAGLMLARPGEVLRDVDALSEHTEALLPGLVQATLGAARQVVDRVVVLSSSPLAGWRQEAALKILEMTAGRYPVMAESYLGLRHGPMVFVTPSTLVLCLLSSDPLRRAYELDLVGELREKRIGYLAGIAETGDGERHFDAVIPAVAPHLDDALRTPFEIVGAQLLGYNVSLLAGLNPDNPSPDGIINRVVQGVRIHALDGQHSVTLG